MTPDSDRGSRGRRPHSPGHSNLQVGSGSSGHWPQSMGGSRHLSFSVPASSRLSRSPSLHHEPQITLLPPRPHLASRYRKRSARGLGSQHGVGRAQMHRRWSRHSQVPRSLGGSGEAGLGSPKAWNQAILPMDTASKG